MIFQICIFPMMDTMGRFLDRVYLLDAEISITSAHNTDCSVLTYPWSKKSGIYADFRASSSENPYWTESQPPLYLTSEAGIRHHGERNTPRRNPKTASSPDACDFRLKGAGIANHTSLYLPQPSNQINFHS